MFNYYHIAEKFSLDSSRIAYIFPSTEYILYARSHAFILLYVYTITHMKYGFPAGGTTYFHPVVVVTFGKQVSNCNFIDGMVSLRPLN